MNGGPSAIEQFLSDPAVAGHIAKGTIDAYRGDLRSLTRWLKKRGLEPELASALDLQEFMESRVTEGGNPRSVSRQLSTFRRYYEYLMLCGCIVIDPTPGLRAPTGSRASRPKAISQREARQLLAGPDGWSARHIRDGVMLALTYSLGVRVSELITLTLGQVDFRSHVISVGRGRCVRNLPLDDELERRLRTYLQQARVHLSAEGAASEFLFPTARGVPMTRQAFWHIAKRVARGRGLPEEFSPHTLRISFAKHAKAAGVNIQVLQRMLGHQNLSTTRRYLADVHPLHARRRNHMTRTSPVT